MQKLHHLKILELAQVVHLKAYHAQIIYNAVRDQPVKMVYVKYVIRIIVLVQIIVYVQVVVVGKDHVRAVLLIICHVRAMEIAVVVFATMDYVDYL